ncbi:hypothetical protein [Flagellimonas pacifica]|uniref:Lipocalin-like domain-containing protein n=1 Tax=Flagellimonas pacifica TaxID=1247520 RepID=A0A285MT87_9FLAO|nr:hypothetical protein [Allomuricauda parva]SNZ00419.1 hypothetical protein SAMN06265377_2243 [Allomuricauda parva]
MKKVFLISTFIFFIISCTKEDNLPINSDVIGKWNWISTKGGVGNNVDETPASTEKTIVLILNKNYTYSILENDSEISNGTYEMKTKKSIYKKDLERFVSYSKNVQVPNVIVSGVLRVQSSGNLSILDNKADGLQSDFKKVE